MALLKNSAAILMPCFSNRVLGLKQDYVYLLLDVLSLRVLLTLLSAIKYNINLENLLKKKFNLEEEDESYEMKRDEIHKKRRGVM